MVCFCYLTSSLFTIFWSKVAAVHKSHMHQSNATDSSPERPQPIESAAGKHQEDPTAGETR